MGQIAKSQDLASAIQLIGSALLLIVVGAFIVGSLGRIMRRVLEDTGLPDPVALGGLVQEIALRGGIALAPVLGVALLLGFLSHYVQVGPLFTTRPLVPKLDRLNPIAGLGRLFSRKNLMKAVVNSLKLILVVGATWLVMRGAVGEVVSIPRLHLEGGLIVLGKTLAILAAVLLLLLLLLGVVDYIYQRWQHQQDLKMTKDSVKDERKSMEGDPKVKAARYRMARQIALQRINQAVPGADVVVTNPTHFAVALRYDEATMRAPRVVAKGADYLAMRIRLVAGVHAVPVVERPPLARALYAGCEVGQEVPAELYQAVAEVLAFVYRLEQEAA